MGREAAEEERIIIELCATESQELLNLDPDDNEFLSPQSLLSKKGLQHSVHKIFIEDKDQDLISVRNNHHLKEVLRCIPMPHRFVGIAKS